MDNDKQVQDAITALEAARAPLAVSHGGFIETRPTTLAIEEIETVRDSLAFEQRTRLGSAEFGLRFVWSEPERAWFLKLLSGSGAALTPWVRVVLNAPLLRRLTGAELPCGSLMAIDRSGAAREIETPGDLGTRVVLTFTPVAQVHP